MTGSLSCWSTCRRRSTCSSPRARIRPCRWHGCEGAGSCWRSAPPICASRRRRPRSTSTTRWGWNWGHRTSGLWRVAPKGGLPHCSSRRSPCGAADDAAGFIAGFAGDDRYVVHYLAEEVLQHQTEEVRKFLLRTSVLGRLNGSLCEAVTGQDGGNAMLHTLDRENLFLIPLDDGRRWYRYHHLFADVLQTHLRDEQPESCRICTDGRATGTSGMANGPRRSTTHWPRRTTSASPTWPGWRSPPWPEAGRKPRCGDGWRRFPSSCSRPGPFCASGMAAPSCP